MPNSDFDIERVRLEAARSLPPRCFDDFQRLTRSLLHGPAFQWLLVDAADERLRRDVMAAVDRVLAAAGLAVNQLPLGRGVGDVAALEARLVKSASRAAVVHVVGAKGWFNAARWEDFNVRRERIAATARSRLVFWLDAEAISLASQGAPDLWAWRAGVYAFGAGVAKAEKTHFVSHPAVAPGVDVRSMLERHRRIAQIRDWIESHPEAPDDLLVAPRDELGRLLFSVGDYDAALTNARDQLQLHIRRGDDRSIAVAHGRIADVLQHRGEWTEALHIRRHEELPVHERLGNHHERAITMGKIADVLQARGEVDAALRIRREDELPIYEKLGDQRGWAIAMGRIADALHARGDTDESLDIRRKHQIPAYEKIGDERGRSVAMGRIAEALAERGELDEALRIRREDELPVYERLGDRRALAVTWMNIGGLLWQRGDSGEAARLLRKAYGALASMRLPEAEQVAAFMGARGISMGND